MKFSYMIPILIGFFSGDLAFAQSDENDSEFFLPVVEIPESARPISAETIYERLGVGIDTGFIPNSIEDMIATSSIIVKGSFGKRLSHQKFWGYGTTREQFEREHDLSDEDIDQFGLPLSEYEIEVDEVLMGSVSDNRVVFRTYESDPDKRLHTEETVERLFFLTINPDGQGYSNLGPSFILTNIGGEYRYEDFEDMRLDSPVLRSLPFAESMDVEILDQLVRDEIELYSRLD